MQHNKQHMPSDWHIQEAIKRMDWGGLPPTVNTVKSSHYIHVIAHARTLAEFLPAPVDPDDEAVKRIVRAFLADKPVDDSWAAALAQYKAEIAARMEGMQPKIGRVSQAMLDDATLYCEKTVATYSALRRLLDQMGIDHD